VRDERVELVAKYGARRARSKQNMHLIDSLEDARVIEDLKGIKRNIFMMESLILAQGKRWRRA
jgi:hypothetical protein